jgi:hypothetical protein
MPTYTLGVVMVNKKVWEKQLWEVSDEDLPEYFSELEGSDLIDYIVNNGEYVDTIDEDEIEDGEITEVEIISKTEGTGLSY